jgi:hypothetical protein
LIAHAPGATAVESVDRWLDELLHHMQHAPVTIPIDYPTRLQLSVAAEVDIKTIEKALRGEPIKGRAGHRARGVLRRAGYKIPRAPTWMPPSRAMNRL